MTRPGTPGRDESWEFRSGFTGPSSSTFPPDFPKRLARFREVSGLSWKTLARLLGVRPYRIWKWRKKGVAPSPAHLFLLLTLADTMGLRDGILMCPERDIPKGMDRKTLRRRSVCKSSDPVGPNCRVQIEED